jgi:hypothetical protein
MIEDVFAGKRNAYQMTRQFDNDDCGVKGDGI